MAIFSHHRGGSADSTSRALPGRLNKLRHLSPKNTVCAPVCEKPSDPTPQPTGLAPPSIERAPSSSSVRSIDSINAWNRLSLISSVDDDSPKRYSLHIPDDTPPASPSTDASSIITCDSMVYTSKLESTDLFPEMKRFGTPLASTASEEPWNQYLERVFQLGATDRTGSRLSATELDSPVLPSSSEITISANEYMSEDEWLDYENVLIDEHAAPSRKTSLVSVPSRWKKYRQSKSSSKSVSYKPYNPFSNSTQPRAGPSVSASDATAVAPIQPLSFTCFEMDDELNLPPSISVTPPQETSSKESSSENETPSSAPQPALLAPPTTSTLENGLVTRSITNAQKTTPSRYVMLDSYPKWSSTNKPAIRPRQKSVRAKSAPAFLRKTTPARRSSTTTRPKRHTANYEADAAVGVLTRNSTNAKESTPRRVVMNDSGFPLFKTRGSALQSTALETVSEKPEMMLGDEVKEVMEVPKIVVRAPTVRIQRRRGVLMKKSRSQVRSMTLD
ncbi:hypothetical protein MBLNU457_g2465t1 [Dothideomycetes sp. NU457]